MPKWEWDVDINTSRASLERLGHALIETFSQLLDSTLIGSFPLGKNTTALLRVGIPEGNENRFREIVKPISMKPPPIPDDFPTVRHEQEKHPGRRN